jgi:hypothetical protein
VACFWVLWQYHVIGLVRSNPSLAQQYDIIGSTYQYFLVASTEESGKGRGDSKSRKGKELKLHLGFV